MGAIGALALISHTHGPKRTPRNRNLLSGATVTREARTLTDVTGCGIGNMDFQLDAVKEQVSQVRHHPDGAAGQGTPTSGRHSGPQGRAGGSLPSAFTGADTGLAALRTVSATPVYGSRRTLGFPPRRDHLGTGGPSRRPPSAGCADQRSAFPCLCVTPPGGMGAMRHVQRPRGALWDTVSAPRYEKSDLTVVAARFVFRYCPVIVPAGPSEDVREVGGQQIAPVSPV